MAPDTAAAPSLADVLTWTRKMRGGAYGPWHIWNGAQTWCGRRMPGVKAWARVKMTALPIEDRPCPFCMRAVMNGRPKAYCR